MATAVAWLLLTAACGGRISFRSLEVPGGQQPGGFISLASPSVEISGQVYRPLRKGRRPAIVLLHGGTGVTPGHHEWAVWLSTEGYVAVIVDSLSSRAPGRTSTWHGGRGASVNEMSADAHGALVHLRTLAYVDPDRIAVMGWSYGGMAALAAIDPEGRVARAYPQGPAFRAAVLIYPICENFPPGARLPILILTGDEDPGGGGPCARAAARLGDRATPIQVKVYPDAPHGFDEQVAGLFRPEVTDDARARVRQFLRAYLDLGQDDERSSGS